MRWLNPARHVLVLLPFALFDVICQQRMIEMCGVSGQSRGSLDSANIQFATDIQGPKQFHL